MSTPARRASLNVPAFTRRRSVATAIRYPMHVMRVSAFLDRYGAGERRLESHQLLRRLGLVVPCPDNEEDVLFISQ
jgi:hypothetical protein